MIKYGLSVILISVLSLGNCTLLDLSCDEVNEIVDSHNSRRLQLAKGQVSGQPAGANIKYMAWDDELAAKAAKWASKGIFEHNPDRYVGSGKYSLTGENIYEYMTTDSSYKFRFDEGLASWFDEYKDYEFAALTEEDFQRPSDSEIGHYTQMAWADSTHVGCGLSRNRENGWTKYIFVCNYGPAGNMIGEYPYSTADDGSTGELLCGDDNCDTPYGDLC